MPKNDCGQDFKFSSEKNYLRNVQDIILRRMEFTAIIHGETYRFSLLNKNSFLVSGNRSEYILYKTGNWHCADEISPGLVSKLGEAIEEYLHVLH